MTPEKIAEAKALIQYHYHTMPERHKGEVQTSHLALLKMRSNCDHKNPDGTSAGRNGSCSICQGTGGVVRLGEHSLRLKASE